MVKAINYMADSWTKECECDDQEEEEFPITPVKMAIAWAIGVTILLGISQSILRPMAQYIVYYYAKKPKTVPS